MSAKREYAEPDCDTIGIDFLVLTYTLNIFSHVMERHVLKHHNGIGYVIKDEALAGNGPE